MLRCFNRVGLLKKTNSKSGWLSRDSSACLCLFFFPIVLSFNFETRNNVSWEIDAREQSRSTKVRVEAPISEGFRNWCFESDFCYNSSWSIHNYLIVISFIQKTRFPSLQKHFGGRVWGKIEKVENQWLDPPSIERRLSDRRRICFSMREMQVYAEWVTLFSAQKFLLGKLI